MADYATGITASVPALDMVIVDTPTLGWWTGRGFVGRSSAGFETMLAVAPATVALTEPSWTLDPRVELWQRGDVTATCYVGVGGDPPSLTTGNGTVTFDPDDIPDRFVFLWPRLGVEVSWTLTVDQRSEVAAARAMLPATLWERA